MKPEQIANVAWLLERRLCDVRNASRPGQEQIEEVIEIVRATAELIGALAVRVRRLEHEVARLRPVPGFEARFPLAQGNPDASPRNAG